MKLVIILSVISLAAFALADTKTYSRGCIYINGRCFSECEEGTHAYTTGCGLLTPEPSCDVPEPQEDARSGTICDYSSCYCDPPTVRHPNTKKCVHLQDCPKKL